MDYCKKKIIESDDYGETGLDNLGNIDIDKDNIKKHSYLIDTDTLLTYKECNTQSKYKWLDKKNNIRGYIDVVSKKDITSETNLEIIFYIHGGGFVMYDPIFYRSMTYILNKTTNIPVFCPDYPLVNNKGKGNYDIIMEYLLSCIKYIILHKGVGKINLMGDSSGGTIAIQFVNFLIKHHSKWYSYINKMILYSPWIDLECNSNSYLTRQFCGNTNAGDPVFKDKAGVTRKSYREDALKYLGDRDIKQFNPIHTKKEYFNKYPPTLIFIGDDETIRDDSIRFVHNSKISGNNDIYTIVYNQMWHVWVMYSQGCGGDDKLSEGVDVYKKTDLFIKKGMKSINKENNITNIGFVL